jgi:hypothetical protein
MSISARFGFGRGARFLVCGNRLRELLAAPS